MNFYDVFSPAIAKDQIALDETTREAYSRDWCPKYESTPEAVLFPKSTEDVAEIIKLANKHKITLTPAGGRTGLSGGAAPVGSSIVVSLEKLNKVLDLNSTQRTLVAQAGAATAKVHEAAETEDLYFPVHFASQESSMIGGNAGTNVGGIHVLRYGPFRDWVLGIKVVTGKGDILDINSDLYKNQTGYDLKNLFIGSEGTLGIISELTLKLTSKPIGHTRIVGAISSPEKALELLLALRSSKLTLSALEYFDRCGLAEVLAEHSLKDPLSEVFDHYVLIELEDSEHDNSEELEGLFSDCLESGLLLDAVVSQSITQANELLALRERIGEVLASKHKAHKNDLAVPVKDIPRFLKELSSLIKSEYHGYQYSVFGHIGDGNLHLNILKPEGMGKTEFLTQCTKADQAVFQLIRKFKGSISAEHGVGLLKKDYLHFSRSEAEIAYMKEIKKVFDPNGILNPGKIF